MVAFSMSKPIMDKKILFICTGNYYRSRYAEIFFNDMALKMDIPWRAVSRGILANQSNNVGPISKFTVDRLNMRNISFDAARFPMQLEEQDLRDANLVIALDANEHKPMMEKYFSSWAKRVTYWDAPDLHLAASEEALFTIEENIRALTRNLEKNLGMLI